MLYFQIDEKMKDELQADCTRYAPGIEIISVRVTKPTIPDSIRRNFVQMEEERTKVHHLFFFQVFFHFFPLTEENMLVFSYSSETVFRF